MGIIRPTLDAENHPVSHPNHSKKILRNTNIAKNLPKVIKFAPTHGKFDNTVIDGAILPTSDGTKERHGRTDNAFLDADARHPYVNPGPGNGH